MVDAHMVDAHMPEDFGRIQLSVAGADVLVKSKNDPPPCNYRFPDVYGSIQKRAVAAMASLWHVY